jgi:hypothetical protein
MNSRFQRRFMACSITVMLLATGFSLRESLRAHLVAEQRDALIADLNLLKRRSDVIESKVRERGRARIKSGQLNPPSRSSAAPSRQAPKSDTTAALRLQSAKADMRSTLGPLFRELALSPVDVDRLLDRMVHHESVRSTTLADMPAGSGNNPNDPRVQYVKDQLAREDSRYSTDLKAILGPENHTRFEEFQREIPFWTQASKLATQLFATDNPLSPDQSQQLVAVLIAGATDANGQLMRTVSKWDDVFAQARGFLSPPQLDALITLHEHDELWRQLNRLRAKTFRTMQQSAMN